MIIYVKKIISNYLSSVFNGVVSGDTTSMLQKLFDLFFLMDKQPLEPICKVYVLETSILMDCTRISSILYFLKRFHLVNCNIIENYLIGCCGDCAFASLIFSQVIISTQTQLLFSIYTKGDVPSKTIDLTFATAREAIGIIGLQGVEVIDMMGKSDCCFYFLSYNCNFLLILFLCWYFVFCFLFVVKHLQQVHHIIWRYQI